MNASFVLITLRVMIYLTRSVRSTFLALLILAPAALALAAKPAPLEQMDLERWAKLREVERFQLQVAEKYYRDENWKIAAAEYEKYVTQYERSDAAPHAQLQWALCQVRLRQANTAIQDGFQAVIDYWPDSPDAVVARYFMGDTYRKIGQTDKAQKTFAELIAAQPRHPAAIRAMSDALAIATEQKDRAAQAELWKKLTYEIERTSQTGALCVQAAHDLAVHEFSRLAFDEGLKALATSHADRELPAAVCKYAGQALAELSDKPETRAQADKLLEAAVAWLRQHAADAPGEGGQSSVSGSSTPARSASEGRQTWLAIADLRAAARANDQVVQTYQEIFRRFGEDDPTLGRLAGWYESINRFDDARSTYRRYADKAAGLHRVAQSYARQKQYEQAAGTYRELARLEPDTFRWKGDLAAALADARKFNEALETYSALIEQDAAHADAWRWKMALTYKEARRWKEAIAQLRQCDKFPENYLEMALCHRAAGQYGEAVSLYQQVIVGHPKSAPAALFQIGKTYEQAGQKEKAIKAFQQVCKQYPRDPYASQAHSRLQSEYKISVTLGGDVEQ